MNTDKKYKIQVIVSGHTLTYNHCKIISEDNTWLEFSDKFGTTFKYNKNIILSMEELKGDGK